MISWNRHAKVNVKALIILLVVTVALGASLLAARQVRREVLSKRDLAAGNAAYEDQDWATAYEHLREYLGRNPDDIEVIKKYARARLSMRPLDAGMIAGAIAAYRRVIQLDPLDEVAYDKLVLLYRGVRDFDELYYIAKKRMGHVANDRKAPLWLAEALLGLDRGDEARPGLEDFIEKLESLSGEYPEHGRACVLMHQSLRDAESVEDAETALKWLNRAIDYAPARDSVEALLYRAQFYRVTPEISGMSEEERGTTAQRDLEKVAEIGTKDPRMRFFLAAEWMAFEEYDRAHAELQAVADLPQEQLEEYFMDVDDWAAAKYVLQAELATRRKAVKDGAALADEMLEMLKQRRHRNQVLPYAIRFYLTADRVSDAQHYLEEEYATSQRGQESDQRFKLRIATLRALVAWAQERHYVVINTLEPYINEASDSGLWRILAEAYSRTDQARRSVSALTSYLGTNPNDGEMRLQLAKEYLKLRGWNNALETATQAEFLDPANVVSSLVRLESSIYIAAEQSSTVDTARLEELTADLALQRQTHPDEVGIRILQAVVFNYLGQPDRAEAELKLAIEECEEPLRAEMQLVGHYYRANRMTEALTICQQACERHAEVGEPWLSLSGLYVANEDNASARSCLERGLETVVGPWEKRAVSIRLALLELMNGDRTWGIKLLMDLAGQDKNEIHVRSLLLGIREVQEGQKTAQKLIHELKAAQGENGLLWRLHQASLWLSSDEWRSRQMEIVDLLQQCIDLDPMWSAPVLLMADMYDKLNDFAHIEDCCRQGLVRNRAATDIADRLVTVLERQERFSEARQVLEQAEASEDVKSRWRVRTALRASEFSRAINELTARVSNDERDANSRILLARLIYWQSRDAQRALAHLKEAEATMPDSMALISLRVSILRAEGRTEEARQILNNYVTDQGDFSSYVMRGAYLTSEGEVEQAEKDYRRLIEFQGKGVQGYELLSRFYLRNNKLDRAIATLKEGLNVHAGDLRLQRALMKLLFMRGQEQDRERALALLGLLEERLKQDPELMMLRALHALEEPDASSPEAAVAKLKEVIRLEPTEVRAHLTLIRVFMQREEYENARDFAIRGLGSNPNNLALLCARARAELALENAPLAVELAHQALQEDPNSTDALTVLVDAAVRTKDRDLLEKVQTLTETSAGATAQGEQWLLCRAEIMSNLGQLQTAVSELEAYCRTIEGDPSVNIMVTLADLHRVTGNMEKSQQWIEQAERVDPNAQLVVHARVLWLVARNRLEDLRQISSEYITAKAQSREIVLAGAVILLGLDSAELSNQGIKLLEHAVVRWPGSTAARLNLASTLYRVGEADRAEEAYQDLLKKYPNHIRVLNDLAWILQEHFQRYDEALVLADRGLRFARNDKERQYLLDTRGTILSNIPERYGDARADFETLKSLFPAESQGQAEALLKLGRICVKLKDLNQARLHLQEALEIDTEIKVFTADERAEIQMILQEEE